MKLRLIICKLDTTIKNGQLARAGFSHTCTAASCLNQAEQLFCLKQRLRSFLERQLREVKAEIFESCGRYGVSSVTEMEARYPGMTLEEFGSRRDLQRLDHLEHKPDSLLQLLKVKTFPCFRKLGQRTHLTSLLHLQAWMLVVGSIYNSNLDRRCEEVPQEY